MPGRKNTRTKKQIRKDANPSLWIVCGLIVMVLAVYGHSIGFDYVHYDDNAYASENPHVQNGLTREGIRWAFTTTYANFWHPLTWLSLMLDSHIWGPGPLGHHFFSLIIHVINTVMLFWVLATMTGSRWRSAFAAALFAVHPLHVESVVWIAQRKDVLSALFWILTMWAYARYVRRPGIYPYLLVIVAYVLGLMAKPMGVTLPFALIILDYWPLKRQQPFWRLVFEKTPLFFISAAAAALAFWAQKSGGAVVSVEALSLQVRLLNALAAYAGYLWKTFWPFQLAVFYPLPPDTSYLPGIGAAVVLLAATAAVVWARNTHPYLCAGWLWFLGTLVPVIGLVKVGEFAMADRYTYIPLIGIYIMLAWGGHDLLAARLPTGRLRAALPVLFLLLIAVRAYDQTTHWKDGFTLFAHALQATRANYVAHNNLAVLYLRQGDLNEAQAHLQQALQFKADSDEAHHNMGSLLSRRGEIEKAIGHYYRALEINPENSDAHYNLGGIYKQQGQYTAAAAHYKKVVKSIPHDWQALYRLAGCLMQMGDIHQATAALEATLRYRPDHPGAKKDLDNAQRVMAKLEKQIETLRNEEGANPDSVEQNLQLGDLLIVVGSPDQSVRYYHRALALAPDHRESLEGLAWAYIQTREYEKALAVLKRLSALSPELAVIDYNIACAYARAQKPKESMTWLKSALDKGYDNWRRIRWDEDLDPIRTTPAFKTLMKTHFPHPDLQG